MTAVPMVKGWCPGALRPMLSGDGLVVRVRPRVARLSLVQARGIADIAATHGNGYIQITSRANLQVRGIAVEALPAVTAKLAGLDLLDTTPEAEARRNILVNPFWYSGGDQFYLGTVEIAEGLAARLASSAAPALPSKFGFAVDANVRIRNLADFAADIRIETAWDDLIVRADGAPLGRKVASASIAVDLAMAMAEWFVASGGVGPDGRGRMRDHIARGAVLPDDLRGDTQPSLDAVPYQVGHRGGGICAGFAFGQVPAERLRFIARKMWRPIRVTPWRSLFLEFPSFPASLHRNSDIILRPDDPRLRVTACTGAPGCPQGHQPVRALAERLAPLLAPTAQLHVSGCAKGCAHPGPAELTLVGTPEGFDLVRNGRAGDPPKQRHLSGRAIAAAVAGPENLPDDPADGI